METVDKCEIAKEMLDAAIEEYLDHGRLFAAYNLAGVAEELFGKLVRITGDKDSLTDTVENVKAISEVIGGEPGDDKSIKRLVTRTKNSIKHMDSKNDRHVVVNIEDEVRWKIADAIRNYDKLEFSCSPNIERFFCHRKEELRQNKAPKPTQ